MQTINVITVNSVINYAAEELKKYLRMMMPENGNYRIVYGDGSGVGFQLGVMQDFGLDVSDAKDPELDDLLYIDCDEKGGIIAGDNPRAVLLAVYEYLRQNGCRWLFPGVDGEYIPMQSIKPVKYRHKPSCRYRGWCSEGAQFQSGVLDAIDFAPKVGLNVYMIQFINPALFYRRYYEHIENQENYASEPISDEQALQWKRQCEAEIARRGLQFHDIGHGFNCYPFGIAENQMCKEEDIDSFITPQQREFLSELGGARKFFKNGTSITNFCMSNPKARTIVAEYVADFAAKHGNIDYLHVWLADGSNNHCECLECQKKTPSDWYIMLLNEIDEKLTEINSDMKIMFISYVDTTWAPLEETIKNPDRFALLFAPIFRSYAHSVPENREKTKLEPYRRNNNKFPATIGASLDYFEEWKKVWKGSNVSYEYHFWRHQCYDLSGMMQARMITEDIKAYIKNDIDGVIACGTQRAFFPNGLSFYTFARSMFDASLTFEEIREDYYSHAYGESWREICNYLERIYEALPFTFFSRDMAGKRKEVHYDLERAEKIEGIRSITKEGRVLIKAAHKYDYRVRTTALRLLEYHADFCDAIACWMAAKARGEIEEAKALLEKARIETGKREVEFREFFDHNLFFTEYFHTQNLVSPKKEDIVSI